MYKPLLVISLCLLCVNARIATNVRSDEIAPPSNSITEKPQDTFDNGDQTKTDPSVIQEVEATTENRVAAGIKIDLEITTPSNQTNEAIKPQKEREAKKVDIGEALLLTPLIKRGKLKQARRASKVNPEMFFGLASHSGFLTVDEEYNSNLFFWYFPVPNKPVDETPWLIWLQGGPGASVMTGLFDEIGPITVDENLELKYRNETWGKEHSLLFIENPVGTGFSFTDNKKGYARYTTASSVQLYAALQQFLQLFPELREAPLFITGESYAGKYVPGLAMEIHNRRESHERINLKGLAIGNGFVDPSTVANYSRVAYNLGLVDAEGAKTLKGMEDQYMRLLNANNSLAARNQWQSTVIHLHLTTFASQLYNFLKDNLGLRRYEAFLRRPDVKRAIHVGSIPYNFVNITVNTEMAYDFLSNSRPIMEELLEHYRVLMYSGQLDMMVPYVLTEENIRTWRWSGSEEFAAAVRHPWTCGGKVTGFHKSGGKLTEVMVRGAGHTVPIDQPAAAKELIERFVSGRPLRELSIMQAHRRMLSAGRAEGIYL